MSITLQLYYVTVVKEQLIQLCDIIPHFGYLWQQLTQKQKKIISL